MQKGNIGVTTENIFPVIKKFLYSDHEIFLREMVSNAVDATQKMKTLAEKGEYTGETDSLSVHVSLDKEAGTLTISDNGIGMTEEEIDKYINQIAFSGVNDFLDKYKDNKNNIIGHFGLGFYSAFMVSKKVDIITKSYKEGSKAVKWSCDGSPEYEIDDAERESNGSDIVLYIADDCTDFLEKSKIQDLLDKYCKFLPVPIIFGKKTERKDNAEVETDEDNLINNVDPLWIKSPSELKDEDYISFYKTLYPVYDEPMFWIHLNVDYPFNLTGILYFPKIKNNIELQRNKIQLYCNRVFVTDQVDGIVPDFMTLLHGVIDSPDIPLNVSRSYLQSDAEVKKISTYITKKVCDKLLSIFKENRTEYEDKWESLKVFINYGMLSDNNASFYDKAKEFYLLKDVDKKKYSLEEYKTLIEANQKDKDGKLIYLYADDVDSQYTYIEAAKNKGYSVLLTDGELDIPIVAYLERKFDNSAFVRVDSDIIDKLIVKEDANEDDMSEELRDNLTELFNSQISYKKNTNFEVNSHALGEDNQPIVMTQSEYMRRMKDISKYNPAISFYSQMPDTYTLVLNTDHRLIKNLISDCQEKTDAELNPVMDHLKELDTKLKDLNSEKDKKKDEDVTQEEKDAITAVEKEIDDNKKKKKDILDKYAGSNDIIHQLIDLSMLQNGMLKGQALTSFLKRSVDLIK